MRCSPLSATRAGLCVAGLAVALVAPTVAAAQAPSPDLAAMALQPSDFPFGAKVTAPGEPGGPTYEQTFRVGDRAFGQPAPAYADQFIEALPSAGAARADLALTKRRLASKRGRANFARSIIQGGGQRIRTKDVKVRPVRNVVAGDAAFELRFTLRGSGVAVDVDFMRVDRVETVVALVASTRSQVLHRRVSILRTAAAHIRAGLAADGTAPPAPSGPPSTGQTGVGG